MTKTREQMDKHNAYRRAKRKGNPYIWGDTLEKHRVSSREDYRKKKKEVVERLGGKCLKCAFEDFRALTIDHKDGNGNQERKLYGWKYIKMLYVLPVEELKKKYQCLCSNCNVIKEFERKWVK